MPSATVRGGEKLKKHLEETARKLATGKSLEVGFLAGATYPTGGIPVAAVAAIQEFGAPGAAFPIPPRPFFRKMIAANKAKWGPAMTALMKAKDYNARAVLNMMGEEIRGALQQSIIDTNAPALSPVTVMLRKMKSQDQSLVVTRRTVRVAAARVAAGESTAGASQKPLVETGHLLNSVDFEVK